MGWQIWGGITIYLAPLTFCDKNPISTQTDHRKRADGGTLVIVITQIQDSSPHAQKSTEAQEQTRCQTSSWGDWKVWESTERPACRCVRQWGRARIPGQPLGRLHIYAQLLEGSAGRLSVRVGVCKEVCTSSWSGTTASVVRMCSASNWGDQKSPGELLDEGLSSAKGQTLE